MGYGPGDAEFESRMAEARAENARGYAEQAR